ncbi:MAG: hypothetical protein JSS54_00040 [Proteobacteria bacterium]|nr:hypothetical protein [Pseudomonadota bacterium]
MKLSSALSSRGSERSLQHIFMVPILIALASLAGLAAALLGDGWFDVIGWIGLGIPAAVASWCVYRT